jgi:hypothetical protein
MQSRFVLRNCTNNFLPSNPHIQKPKKQISNNNINFKSSLNALPVVTTAAFDQIQKDWWNLIGGKRGVLIYSEKYVHNPSKVCCVQ